MLPPIHRHDHTIDMPRRLATQPHHNTLNILRPPQPPIRRGLRVLPLPSRLLNQLLRHLGHKETRRDTIHQHSLRPQRNRHMLAEVMHGRLRRGVRVSPLLPDAPDGDAGDGADGDDAAGVGGGRGGGEEREERLREQEDGVHVEVKDLAEARGRELFKRRAPCGARVRDQDVDRCDAGGFDRLGEARHFGRLGEVGRDREVARFRVLGFELGDGGFAGVGFARGDDER